MSTTDQTDEVEFLPAEVEPEQDLDAVELMWMKRMEEPFEPTPAKPMRALRCTGVTRTGVRAGKRCGREATLGTHVCEKHGASLPVVKEAAARRVDELYLRLLQNGHTAVDTLVELMETATSETVRLGAAKDVLDRAGVRGGSELDVTVRPGGLTPADVLQDRLAKMRERTQPTVVDVDEVKEGYDDESEPLELGSDELHPNSAEGENSHG